MAALIVAILTAGVGPAVPPDFAAERERMVATQIEARGVRDPRVLAAMRRVPRHRFVPDALAAEAHDDRPLPIGNDQTISQPYVVAVMSELLAPKRGDKVLEIGTGSGYQAAILAELGALVFSIEIVPELAALARRNLSENGYDEVVVIQGDGWLGLPKEAPFDRILVTAAPDEVPSALVDQLRVGGRLVLPVGTADQRLRVIEKTASGLETRDIFGVRFVPMIKGPQAPVP
jgi:protein-L-isoaspartate(D-aspartate) O-methyltransferase